MQITLANKTAVVTGASSDIGLAVTRRYLECGATGVVAVFRRAQIPEELIACQKEFGDRLHIVRGDVAEESTAIEFTQAALERWGRLDVLVSNAAKSVVKAIHEHTPEEWDSVMNANVKAMYWASRHVIPVMIRQNGGLI
ncbi:MAG TPA: SDR family NAD(P)-dependent oxidoreductase, partial [Acidobacteriaceae bacterium]|nr:SDR family NAD(P)-dependent oxidoreductase [Acidobacteriaceae bacterium]